MPSSSLSAVISVATVALISGRMDVGDAFQITAQPYYSSRFHHGTVALQRPSCSCYAQQKRPFDNHNSEEDEEVFLYQKSNDVLFDNPQQQQQARQSSKGSDPNIERNSNYLDDLTPPPVNFARNSILFSENPSTKSRNNPVLDAWTVSRTYLPALVTGAWPWRDVDRMDQQPMAALYNMLFVRIPIVIVIVTYLKNLILDGHGLVMDFGLVGNGPQAVNPILVLGVLCIILL